jgi:predicted transcriptional regulator with HTH domain
LSVARFRLRRRVALANAREGKAGKPLNFLNLSHHVGNDPLNTFSCLEGLIAKFDGLSLPSGSA